MNKSSVKWLVSIVLSIVALAAGTAALAGVSDLIEMPGSAADPKAALNPAVLPVDLDSVTWLPEVEAMARPIDATVRQSIAAAYLAALAILDGDPVFAAADREAYLTGPALAVMPAGEAGVAGRSHTLQISFYSADGQLVEIHDRASYGLLGPGGPRLSREETAVAVLIQVDGAWHLRHRLVDSSSSEVDDPGQSDVVDTTVGTLAAAIFFHEGAALSAVTGSTLLLVAGIAAIAQTTSRKRKPKEKE